MPKTGSSAIQAFLALNQSGLNEQGISYPNPDDFKQLYQTSSGNCYFFHELFAHSKLDKVKRYIDRQLVRSEGKVLFSSEMLFHSLRLYPQRFFEVFNHYDFKIVCYIRRQDLLISSAYKQMVKGRGISTLELEKIETQIDFCSVLLDALKYAVSGNFVIRPYEKAQFFNQNIYDDFCKVIGVKRDQSFSLPEDVVNPSLNQHAFEYRRLLNILRFDCDNFNKKILVNNLLSSYSVQSATSENELGFSVFSLDQRKEILSRYKPKNDRLAEVFFNGKPLFTDMAIHATNGDGKKFELSKDEIERISRYIFRESKKLILEIYAALHIHKNDEEFQYVRNKLLPVFENILSKPLKKEALIIKRFLIIQQLMPIEVRIKYHDLKHRYSVQYFKRKLKIII
jgi:hypothetical protein